MACGVSEKEAKGAQGKQAHAKCSEHGGAQGKFPVPPDWLLHRLKYCPAAQTSLHACLWLVILREVAGIQLTFAGRVPFEESFPVTWLGDSGVSMEASRIVRGCAPLAPERRIAGAASRAAPDRLP